MSDTTTQINRPMTTNTATDTQKPLIHVNGKMLPKDQAAVSVFDHGLLYGDGVFEGIRVYRGKIFKLDQHMDRLWASSEALAIKIHISRDEMVAIQRRCIEANEITDGYIRLVVTRGVGTLGLNPNLCPVPGIICIADQITLYPPEMYEKGMRVVVANRPKTPISVLDPRVKSLNYLNNILAKVEAINHGCLEVIMLNLEGKITEGSGDNLFIVSGGKLHTPPTSAGLLAGITRRFVIEVLAPAAGVEVVERDLELSEVLAADEAFMTGTAAEMVAITQIDTQTPEGKIDQQHTISKGEGPITADLRKRFRAIVTSDNVPED